MRRATTPTHYFTLPFDASMVSRFLLTYKQGSEIVLEKTEKDMDVDGNTWYVKLTQEETNRFVSDVGVIVQVRALTTTGEAIASDLMELRVTQVLNDEVLV